LTTPGGTAGCGLFDAVALETGGEDGGATGAGGFGAGGALSDALVVGIGIGGAGAGTADAIGGAERLLVGATGSGFAGCGTGGGDGGSDASGFTASNWRVTTWPSRPRGCF
jgi:hypothetical protein